MSKRTKTQQAATPSTALVIVQPTIAEQMATLEAQLAAAKAELAARDQQEAADDDEIEEQIKLTNSVVKTAYKVKYRDRARNNGIRNKAAKRSCWDWLAESLAGEVLDKNKKLVVEKLTEILVLDGIEDPEGRWPNRSKGWEGRYRMTGGLALRPLVAEAGVLLVPGEDGEPETLEAPAEWVAKILR